MKSGIPWNLKGIDEETRQAVTDAARRAGMSVGEWLNLVLAEDGQGYEEPREFSSPRSAEAAIESQIAALTERLAQLERSSPSRPAQSASAQTGNVRDLIARLARQIENQDEKARTSVEGLATRMGNAAGRPAYRASTRRLDAAVRELDQRISAFGQRTSSPPEAAPHLDEIRARLDSLLARAPQTAAAARPRVAPLPDAALLDAALQSLESRIDEARARAAARTKAAASDATSSQFARIESRLAEISDRLVAAESLRAKPQRDEELAAAIREIAVHQRAIDERAETAEIRREQQALAEAMAALREEISLLGEKVTSVARVGAEDQGNFFDIARRIDALAANNPAGHASVAALREDLETLASQIDALIARTPGADRIDSLGEEIAAIRRSMEQDDSPRAIQRLEMRLSELSRSIDAALNARNHAFEPAIERLEGHINDIADRLAASLQEATSHAAAVERKLDSRLGEINHHLGAVAETSRYAETIATAHSQLEARLEDIVAHLAGAFDNMPKRTAVDDIQERMQVLAARLDTLAEQQHEPARALAAVQQDISALRNDIANLEVAAAPATENLEAQIRQLADQLDMVAAASNDAAPLGELEAQVASLAAELEHARPRAEAIRNVEESLDRLQAMLADTAKDSIASAREEARKVVSELSVVEPAAQVDPAVIEGLVRDLETLKAAVAASERSGGAETSAVNETMSRVVNRLERLEDETAAAADTTSSAGGASGFRNSMRRTEAPAPAEAKTPADRRADFIAAARRAAQAAALEAKATSGTSASQATATEYDTYAEDDGTDAAERPGAFARISQAIRSRKRPLLLTAAAIVLAIGAMQVFGRLSTGPVPTHAPIAQSATQMPGTNAFGDIVPPSAASTAATNQQTAHATAQAAQPDKALAFAEPMGLDSRFSDGDITGSISSGGFKVQQSTGNSAYSANDSADAVAMAIAAEAAAPAFHNGLDTRLGPTKLLEAASAGEPAAAFEIATRYADGTHVPKDLSKAAEWYAKAAHGGIAVAQYRLGSLYERGQGVKKDLEQAVNWYQRAADQGNINAMHNLAVLMSEGVEGTPDHEKALQWFTAAADYGVRDSQYNLGVMYARGLGLQQDLAESYKWFAAAAAQGDTDAKARRDEVAQAMSADELARARALVAAWNVREPLAEANGVVAPPGGWEGPGDMLDGSDRRSLVAKIQTLLAEQGFDPGPADGRLGPKTVDAVKAYQRQAGQPVTGTISQSLVAVLSGRST